MALFHRKKQVEAPEPEAEPLGLPGAPETDMSGRRSVDDHRDYLCSLVQAVPTVAVDVPRAVGLAVCEDVHAPHDVPVWAVVNDDEILDEVPHDPWDESVTAALTPSGLHMLGQ